MGVTLEQTASTSAWLKDDANQSDAVGIQMNFQEHCRKADEQRFKSNGSETSFFVTVSLESSNNTVTYSMDVSPGASRFYTVLKLYIFKF